jgi:hypothetical protein
VTFAGFAVAPALLAAGASTAVVAAGALFAGNGMMLGNSVWESTLQRHVPQESLSRVAAYDWFGSIAFQPLGMAIWGPIAALIGIDTSLWVASGVILLLTAATLAIAEVRTLRGD